MHNDLIGEFEHCPTTLDIWNKFKIVYGLTSAIRLQALTLKLKQYVMDPIHTMTEHLRTMLTLIYDLKVSSNNLVDEH